jgi:hypothetical protein
MPETMIAQDLVVCSNKLGIAVVILTPVPARLVRSAVKVFDILLLRNPSHPAPKVFSNTPLSMRRKLLTQV